jgi:hypothetical protein
MKFYVIHEERFPLRKVFLKAQFKRYEITDYEFIEIPCSTGILSSYIHILHIISRNKNYNSDNLYCILIDTILLTRKLLDNIEYGHFTLVTSKKSQEIIFIHPNSNHSTKMSREVKTLHKDSWKWDDQTNHSSCFIVTHLSAKLLYEYHKHCENAEEYTDINTIYLSRNSKTGLLEQSMVSLDNWLYECAMKYSNYPLQSYWIS